MPAGFAFPGQSMHLITPTVMPSHLNHDPDLHQTQVTLNFLTELILPEPEHVCVAQGSIFLTTRRDLPLQHVHTRNDFQKNSHLLKSQDISHLSPTHPFLISIYILFKLGGVGFSPFQNQTSAPLCF